MSRVERRQKTTCRAPRMLVLLFPAAFLPGCADSEALSADIPLHLEEHLDAATIIGSEPPRDIPEAMSWRFDEPQPYPSGPSGLDCAGTVPCL